MPEIYEYHDLNSGRSHLIDIGKLARFCAAYMEPHRLAFAPGYREKLRISNDVDVDRAMRLPLEVMAVPPILVETEPGRMIPFDGSHRLWRLLGETATPSCYVVPFDEVLTLAEVSDAVRSSMRTRGSYSQALHRLAARRRHAEPGNLPSDPK